jgi:hypothetical protein
LAFVLDEAKAEVLSAYHAGLIDASHEDVTKGGLMFGRVWLRLNPEEAGELDFRLGELLDEYKNRPADDVDQSQVEYEFLLGLYPIISRDRPVEMTDDQ